MRKKIAIIGGGASGMFAAISAAYELGAGNEIVIFEKNTRLGKKLLATGNGRCNLTNMNCDVSNFHGSNVAFSKYALERFPPTKTIEFFQKIGLHSKVTHGGRVYPYCEQASAVLDILRLEIERLKIQVSDATEIVWVDKKMDCFSVHSDNGACGEFGCVIVATGGNASPSSGSNGKGYEILKGFGHTVIKPYPALTQLKTDTKLAAGMQGVRMNANICVLNKKNMIARSSGEIQFAAYGLTGSAIMDISAKALSVRDSIVILDLMPEHSTGELIEILNIRKKQLSGLACENFLVGILNKKVGQVILKHIGIEKLSLYVNEMNELQISRIAEAIKGLKFSVLGHNGWENAQTTAGGANTNEFYFDSMESKLKKGLFATGEVLDIYGDCGGYNLQWAWSTGYLAGKKAAAIF